MGWYGTFVDHNPTSKERKQIIDDECTFTNENGTYSVVKSTMKGNVWYGVRQFVPANGGPTVRFAEVVKTEYLAKDGQLMEKPMTEDMGPYAYDMPVSYLKDLTDTDNEFANEWRMKVVEHNDVKKRGWEDREWEINGGQVKTPVMVALLSDQTGYPQSAIDQTRWIRAMKPGEKAKVGSVEFKRVYNEKPLDLEGIAHDLNQYACEFDPYNYMDVTGSLQPNDAGYQAILDDLKAGNIEPYMDRLRMDLNDPFQEKDPHLMAMAEDILQRLGQAQTNKRSLWDKIMRR